MSITRQRLQRSDLPDVPCACPFAWPCVYRKEGVCDEPRTNKGNSDAACHTASNKVLLRGLTPVWTPSSFRDEERK